MGKNEDFFPEYVQNEKATNERRAAYEAKKAAALLKEEERKKKEREEEEEIKTAPIERRKAFDKVLLLAVDAAALEIATKIFGEITYKNATESQPLRHDIRITINNYLEKNPAMKDSFYKEMVGGKDAEKLLTKSLVEIYTNDPLSFNRTPNSKEKRDPTPKEKIEIIAVVRSVIKTYLGEEKTPKEPSLHTERNANQALLEQNRSENDPKNLVMLLAVEFFRKNTRVPHENELWDMVNKRLEK
jgi:hypothetical protein